MTGYSFLIGSIVSGALLAVLQNLISKKHIKTFSDTLVYQLFIYVFCAVVMGIAGGMVPFSFYTLVLGLISGILIFAEIACTLEALCCGSMSLTNLFVMASMIVPILPAGLLWNEKLSATALLGTVLTLVSMILILNLYTEFKNRRSAGAVPSGQNGSAISMRWLMLALGAFLAAGLQEIVQKYLTVSDCASELMSFLFVGFSTASVFTELLLVFSVKRKKEPVTVVFTVPLVLGMILSGLSMAVLHLTFMRSLECLPISLALAGSSGARLILLTVIDLLAFHQPLSKEQLAGILVGLSAIILLSL